jgi:hypothetical protein
MSSRLTRTSTPACEAAELHVHEAKTIAWFPHDCQLIELSIAMTQPEAQASALQEGKHFDVGGDSAITTSKSMHCRINCFRCLRRGYTVACYAKVWM